MDLFQAERGIKLLMAAHGLTEKGWRFEWDNAARRFGQCRYSTKTISMSRILTIQRTEAAVRNTALHEIAHALVGPGYGHGIVWRTKAISIGCDGNRCGEDKVEIPYKYIVRCVNGHAGKKYVRRPSGLAKKSCGRCSRFYDPKNALKVYPL